MQISIRNTHERSNYNKEGQSITKVLTKIIADIKVINEHIAKGGHLSDLKGKTGLNNTI